MKTRVKLKIADVITEMQSAFPFLPISEAAKKREAAERFNNFFYSGRQKADILIKVKIVDKLPEVSGSNIFITYHFQDGKENWRLIKRNDTYIYKSTLEDKKQLMLVNKTFDRITAYLLPKDERSVFEEERRKFMRKNKGFLWNTAEIIYDFLQVLLINYFAQRNIGIFTHSIGVKDINGEGLLFTGKSGSGKTTMAKIWHKHSKGTMVLNDDRIIVRKVKDKFFIYGSPWHGEFSDYLESRIESAPLKNLFFIHHASRNTLRRISEKKAFNLLYPALFPTFWDRGGLENIVSFCQDLIKSVPCFNFGFVNNTRVIKFMEKI